MIRRFFSYLLALFFPWIVFLIQSNPGAALVAFLMQATIIGWFPASIWAVKAVASANKAKRRAKKKAKTIQQEEED